MPLFRLERLTALGRINRVDSHLVEVAEAYRLAQETKGASASDALGTAVAVFGDWAVAGAPGSAASGHSGGGAAYLFQRTAAGAWVLRQTLADADVLGASYQFGAAVALGDGLLAVGAPGKSSGAGAVYLFRLGADGVWSALATLVASDAAPSADFGAAVGVASNVVAVGAPGADKGYVYAFDGSTWVETAATGDDTTSGDSYGFAVAASGGVAAFGAKDFSSGAGKVYVFSNSTGSWAQRAAVQASDAAASALFGASVALDGTRLAVGASGAGKVYAFFGSPAEAWTQAAEIVAHSDSSAGDLFGSAVAIFGDRLAAGAPGVDVPGSGAGKVYLFDLDGVEIFGRAGAAAGDAAGSAVALGHGAAATLLDGAPGRDDGLASGVGAIRFVEGDPEAAREIAEATAATAGSWAAATATQLRDERRDPSFEGWTFQVKILTPRGFPIAQALVVGDPGDTLDDVGRDLAIGLNASDFVAGASWDVATSTLTAANVGDGIGDHTIDVTIVPPSAGKHLASLLGASTHEGSAGAALLQVFVRPTLIPRVVSSYSAVR